jgi:predicted NBD/HSP70 family sugar kinase
VYSGWPYAAAHYIAGLCATLVLVASPQRIVLGGGVLQRRCLLPKVRRCSMQVHSITTRAEAACYVSALNYHK